MALAPREEPSLQRKIVSALAVGAFCVLVWFVIEKRMAPPPPPHVPMPYDTPAGK